MCRALLVVVALAGCAIEDDLVECPGDLLCPAASVCDTVHGGCISPEQATACEGLADQTACTAGAVKGYCLDSVCVDPGCGNHVVDPGELCDDGNRDDGDGCASTCLSAERCGDGVMDASRGESCDDGNAMSRDGCDSSCGVETREWTVEPLGPARANAHHMTWDPLHQRVIMVSDSYVWAWTGTRWEALSYDVPHLGDVFDVIWDGGRNKLVSIGANASTGDNLNPTPARGIIHEWDGTTWTPRPSSGAPNVTLEQESLAVTYDPVRQRVIAVSYQALSGEARALSLDTSTMQWTDVSVPPALTAISRGFGLAFDEARGVIVVVIAGDASTTPVVIEWNGSAWSTPVSAPMRALRGWTIGYDAVRHSVVALGAEPVGTVAPVDAWNGAAWAAVTTVPRGRAAPAYAVDRNRNTSVVFGGNSYYESDDVFEYGLGDPAPVPPSTPPAGVERQCAFDEGKRRVVCVGIPGSYLSSPVTWIWDGGWSRGPDPGAYITAIAYDPSRGGVVSWSEGLRVLRDDAWQLTPVAFLNFNAYAMSFDPLARHLVMPGEPTFFGGPMTYFIEADDTLASFSSLPIMSVAYDARNAVTVGIDNDRDCRELRDTTWTLAVGPGNVSRVVANQRRGSVEYYSPGLPILEHLDTRWIQSDDVPPLPVDGNVLMDQRTGELHVIGQDRNSRFWMTRRWISATPLESCADGEDVDGDGLSGCADPDCFVDCSPLCPPYATCP